MNKEKIKKIQVFTDLMMKKLYQMKSIIYWLKKKSQKKMNKIK